MAPIRGQFRQRPHDERALRHAWMGDCERLLRPGFRLNDQIVIGDDVQVQDPRVWCASAILFRVWPVALSMDAHAAAAVAYRARLRRNVCVNFGGRPRVVADTRGAAAVGSLIWCLLQVEYRVPGVIVTSCSTS